MKHVAIKDIARSLCISVSPCRALAIGAMNRLRELGRRVPEDVAVAGFSGTELLRNPDAENLHVVVRTEMKCRASTGE